MKSPTQCVLWDQPELVREPLRQHFELLDTYEKESHWWRYLLKCRECGQLYFFEFYEEIDWDKGNDPQYCTFIPVDSKEEADQFKAVSQFGLLKFFPRLQKNFPEEANQPTVYWVKQSS